MKFLYISQEDKDNKIKYTILRELNTLQELKTFINTIQLVVQPLYTLDNSSDSMVFWNFDALHWLDRYLAEDKALINWFSLRANIDNQRGRQINYSIYTEEQFERQKEHLLNMERIFEVEKEKNLTNN